MYNSMKDLRCFFLACAICVLSISSNSETIVHLYGGANSSVYLGCLNCIETNSTSIWNELGNYGSNLKQTSIWNDLGTYGGNLSSYSPFNNLASNPPKILDDQGGFYGYLTTNTIKSPRATFALAEFVYLFWENIQDDVSSYYDLITQEPLSKYSNVNGMYIFAQDTKEQYLGFITSNKFETESIINEFGSYGSEFSTTSIFNEFSTYGSAFSTYGAFNAFTTTPPIIYSYNSTTKLFTAQYYLTKNTFKTPNIDPEMLKFNLLRNFNVDWSIPSPYSTGVNQHLTQASEQLQKAYIKSSYRKICYDLGKSKKADFLVYNLNGQVLYSTHLSSDKSGTLNLSFLPNGSYVMSFKTEDGDFIRENIILK